MTLITARNSNKKCNGYKGCGEIIFTSSRYTKLRRGKVLCEACYNKLNTKPLTFINKLLLKIAK